MLERITDHKLKNKKFRATEESIVLALSSTHELLSIGRLIRIIGISRSTFYRHHGSIYKIVPDYELYLLHKYRRIVKRLSRIKRIRLRTIYERTLIFMIAHQKILQFLSARGSNNFTEIMLQSLEPIILATTKITDPRVFTIYLKEITGVIEYWQQSGYKREEIPSILSDIMFLTDTASARLASIS